MLYAIAVAGALVRRGQRGMAIDRVLRGRRMRLIEMRPLLNMSSCGSWMLSNELLGGSDKCGTRGS